MIKSAIRTIYKDKRAALSSKDRMKLDDLILIQFQKVSLPDSSYFMNYWPIEAHHEINTQPIADYLLFQMPGLQMAYPKTDFELLTMQAICVHDTTEYEMDRHGIAEPQSGEPLSPEMLDIIFVPMLAYDKQGYRVGYGKGFYDRYLKQCRPDIIKIGFSYFEPEPVISDVNEFDIPLNLVVTPERIYEF